MTLIHYSTWPWYTTQHDHDTLLNMYIIHFSTCTWYTTQHVHDTLLNKTCSKSPQQRGNKPFSCWKTALSSEECSSSKCPCSCVTVPRSFMHIGHKKPSMMSADILSPSLCTYIYGIKCYQVNIDLVCYYCMCISPSASPLWYVPCTFHCIFISWFSFFVCQNSM